MQNILFICSRNRWRSLTAETIYKKHKTIRAKSAGIEDPNVFTFYEIWTDQAGLDAHNEQPYIKDFGPSYGTLLADQPNVIKTTLI